MFRMLKTLASVGLLAIAGLLVAAAPATAVTFEVSCISTNVTDCGIAEAQLSIDVTSFGIGTGVGGTNQVLFTFSNVGPEAAVITEVYFDDVTPLLGTSSLIDADEGGGDAGVDFTAVTGPIALPDGAGLPTPFVATAGFVADTDAPGPVANGVAPGETLGIIFDLGIGFDGAPFFFTFADTIAALADGDLRIGLHVTAFGDGDSVSVVNDGGNGSGNGVIPEPGTLALLGTGLAYIGRRYRRRANG